MELHLESAGLETLAQSAEKIMTFFREERIFILSGNLGAGKTTLVQALCKYLGYSESVSSPTYSLVNEYVQPPLTIYHMDLYRLEEMDEAIEIGIEEYLYSGNYCFIEWPDIILSLLPPPFVVIEINVTPDQTRNIFVKKIDD